MHAADPPTHAQTHTHTLRGILCMLAALTTFGCMDTLAKFLGGTYEAPTITWVRYLFQAIAMIVVLAPRMGWALVRTHNLRWQVVRGGALVLSSLLYIEALRSMPLPEAASITFLSPLLIAVLAGPILHERVSPATWFALGAGFVGALFIVRPGSGVFTWIVILPLGTAVCMAIYQIMTRKLAGVDPSLTTLFYPALVGSIVVPLTFPRQLALPDGAFDAGLFVALGVMGAFGHFLLIKALEYAAATVLAPFVYFQLASVLMLSWLVFDHIPDGWSLVGMMIIAASGLSIALRYRGR